MRIIGGKFGGRRFKPPAKNWPTRPTTDVSKEALFNIITNNFYYEDIKVLDLFCGTGNHSYEFISRGVTDVTCVDKFYGCIQFIRKTAKELDIEAYLTIVKTDVFKFIEQTNQQYDYIFAGPPYGLKTMNLLPDIIMKNKLVKPEGWFVMEHNPNHNYENHPNFDFSRNYGQTIFSIFTGEKSA